MKIKSYLLKVLSVAFLLSPFACKDQLDQGNPNQPPVKIASESDMYAFAQGGVYLTGFANNNDVWLGNSYFSLPWGYHEILADHVGASASNNQITTIGQPSSMKLDDNSTVPNTGSSNVSILRAYNNRAATGGGNNALYYTWVTMYALNNVCNNILAKVDGVKFTGNSDAKIATVKAFAYWWKGYVYQVIGSTYYAGLLIDQSDPGVIVSTVNADYVLHDAVIANSDKYLKLAQTTLAAITDDDAYGFAMGFMIPAVCQVGRGQVLDRTMFDRNINTMLARNILFNHLAPFVNQKFGGSIGGASATPMTPTDWNNVKTYATNGIQKGDFIFTARSTDANSIFTPATGCVAANTALKPSSSTFKISERLLQNFQQGDTLHVDGAALGGTGYATFMVVNGDVTLDTITAVAPYKSFLKGMPEKTTFTGVPTTSSHGSGAVLDIVTVAASKAGGTVTDLASTDVSTAVLHPGGTGYTIADKRIVNNWTATAKGAYKGDFTYTTRWSPVVDGIKDANGKHLVDANKNPTWIYFENTAGALEVVIAGSYEENQLMLAEASIRLGDSETGLGYVDNVRKFMGSDVAATQGTGLTPEQAMQEVVKERKVTLLFRGISFFDNRRWGWSYDISKGGGSYGNTVIYGGVLNTNVTMNYNYMDYWDVPADETVLNPPSGSSSAVVNPNF